MFERASRPRFFIKVLASDIPLLSKGVSRYATQPDFMRFLLILVLALALAAGGCARSASPSVSKAPSTTPTVKQEAEEDSFASALLADKRHCQPALEWLNNSKDHILWGSAKRYALIEHFRALQQAGVKDVWVCTQDLKDKQIAFAFVVVLPAGKSRQAIFELHNRFWDTQLEDPLNIEVAHRSDRGQKYLVYNFN